MIISTSEANYEAKKLILLSTAFAAKPTEIPISQPARSTETIRATKYIVCDPTVQFLAADFNAVTLYVTTVLFELRTDTFQCSAVLRLQYFATA